MKKFKNISYLLIMSLFCFSCNSELIDFTNVTNPNLSESNIVGQANSSGAWLKGIERQTSLLYNEIVVISEIASDNYKNTNTFYNQLLDNLTIDFKDTDMRDLQYAIARLREMADFGLEKVAPNDPNATNEVLAEYHFYKGLTFMLAGEYFSFLPQEEKGDLFSSIENLETALISFDNALNIKSEAKYQLAKARVYHRLGNKSEAVNAANAALNLDADVLFTAQYDALNGPGNLMETALFQRGNFDDLQPLPSLDFLDPKYSFLSNDEDQPIAILKAEEAHFIIAESHLSNNLLNQAKTSMKAALTVVNNRPSKVIDDSAEDRDQRNPGSRPNKAIVQVKYKGDATFKNGLVIDRGANVTSYLISGTSFTVASIDALSTIDEALEALYLMRQEVFIAEGRRIVDLGVKYVIHENELLLNPNIDESSPSLKGVIPPFIDSIKGELDLFTYDSTTNTVEIEHNLNKILVQNRTSEFVIPFF